MLVGEQIWVNLLTHEFVESHPSNSSGVGGLDKKKSPNVSQATLFKFSEHQTQSSFVRKKNLSNLRKYKSLTQTLILIKKLIQIALATIFNFDVLFDN